MVDNVGGEEIIKNERGCRVSLSGLFYAEYEQLY